MTQEPRGTFPWPDDSDPTMRAIAALTLYRRALAFYRRVRPVLSWLLPITIIVSPLDAALPWLRPLVASLVIVDFVVRLVWRLTR